MSPVAEPIQRYQNMGPSDMSQVVLTRCTLSALRQDAAPRDTLPCTKQKLRRGAPDLCRGWPTAGAIVYEGVSASYRPGLPPVLRDLSFRIEVCLWPTT